MRVTKSEIGLEMDCWVDELSTVQLAAYERVANEHNAIKSALKSALSLNEGKELFNGQVFQAYSFKGKVLQEIKEAALPKKPIKNDISPTISGRGKKRNTTLIYLESSDEGEDDIPLAKRIAMVNSKKNTNKAKKIYASVAGKDSPQTSKNVKPTKSSGKVDKAITSTPAPTTFRPSEISSVGGLVIGTESKEITDPKDKDSKDNKDTKDNKEVSKEARLQGKTFPSLVVLAKPWLKVKDMSQTRSKLDSKVKLVLMLTPNKFTEWLIQEGLLKSEQKCANHKNNELKLGVYSDATKFPYTGGYVWISECCPMRFVSVFHGSIFEGAPHPPSCILKLIYHWSCQTNIQNVVQWVKVDNVYIKGVYTWLRAVCTLAVHQKCKKLGGPEKFVEVGVISLGTTSQDGQQRQVKVEVLGVLDYAEKTIRLKAVEPVSDIDRNYKKRFQTILEPLQRWVHKDSVITIDLTVDKMTLYSMGFKNVVQASATDTTAKHTNAAVMDYLRRIVPRMFQNTLSLLSRQMIQQFLDELVWREQFGTYALQAFNSITMHIAEQTRMNTTETLTQRLYQVATNPFKDWSALPANFKSSPVNNTPKRLKKPINDMDYQSGKIIAKQIKRDKESLAPSPKSTPASKRRNEEKYAEKTLRASSNKFPTTNFITRNQLAKNSNNTTLSPFSSMSTNKSNAFNTKKQSEGKSIKKEEDDLKGIEELYYGIRDGLEVNFESFPYKFSGVINAAVDNPDHDVKIECPICDTTQQFDSNEKFQTHLVSHLSSEGKENHQLQCLFCLDKYNNNDVLEKHNEIMHPAETRSEVSYHCLICQQCFNTLQLLSGHLHKMHYFVELPYCCQACNYRSSSHRDLVRHFYDDHKKQNFLQCPFCLDIYHFSFKGHVNVANIENYYMHLKQHMNKRDPNTKCQKCALTFLDKGSLKQHLVNHHVSQSKQQFLVQPLLQNSLMIPIPKVRNHYREPLSFAIQTKLGDFFAFIDGSICAECNTEIITEDHYPGFMKCNKCNYKTCCERTMFEHSTNCNGVMARGSTPMELPLPNEMHCVCGFSTAIGNKMALHLYHCGQKSAYVNVEHALENTVKRNMLDMLGLVRKDDDGDIANIPQQNIEETNEIPEAMQEQIEIVEQEHLAQELSMEQQLQTQQQQILETIPPAQEQQHIRQQQIAQHQHIPPQQQITQQQQISTHVPQQPHIQQQPHIPHQPHVPQQTHIQHQPHVPQQTHILQQRHISQQHIPSTQQQMCVASPENKMQPQTVIISSHNLPESTIIQYGGAPILDGTNQQQLHHPILATAAANVNHQMQEHQQVIYTHIVEPQYQISFAHPDSRHAQVLNSTDMDLPLIGELGVRNPAATQQYMTEIHAPIFATVAAAEQQHYQLLQAPQHQHHQQ